MAKKRTLQSMAYGPGGPPDATGPQTRPINTNPLGSQNWGSGTEEGYSEPNYNVNERGVPELSPAYGSERQDMEEAGIDYGSAIKHRGLDDPSVGAAQPHLFDYQLMNKMTRKPVADYSGKMAPETEGKKSMRNNRRWVRNQNADWRMQELIDFQNRVDSPNPPPPERRGLWDFVNSLGLGDRRKAKESGNKFFDLSGREKREAKKGGYGWKNEYWKNPDADTQQFRMEDKGKFSLFGNLNLFKGKGGGTTISKPMF